MRKRSGTYTFAGIDVKIVYCFEETGLYLSKYESKGKPAFKIKSREKDVAWEEERERAEGMDYGSAKWLYEVMSLLRKFSAKALERDVLLFHSSAVMADGGAYIFAAPSGTGKSTHARLWRKVFGDKVTMINDDKPFFRKVDGIWYAYGSPWNGKHRLDNAVRAPIKGICFLEQGKENEIKQIGWEEGFPRLCKQAYFPEKQVQCENAVRLMGELARLPMYVMKCTISEEAARMSYSAMRGEML